MDSLDFGTTIFKYKHTHHARSPIASFWWNDVLKLFEKKISGSIACNLNSRTWEHL